MILQTTKLYTHTIDIEQERARINRIFANIDTRKRLLDILDALEAKDLNKMFDLYDALPYNEEKECPEQEFLGMWFWNFLDCKKCETIITYKFI